MMAWSRWGYVCLGISATLIVGCGSEDPQSATNSGTESGGSASTPDVPDSGTGGGGSSVDSGTGAAGASAEWPPIFINELVASNVTGVRDSEGGTGDWIELYNAGQEDVDLGGYFVTDNAASPAKGLLKAGLVVPAGGVLLLWADSDTYQGTDHLPFNLAREGEGVFLFTPTYERLDGVSYVSAPSDTAYARFPDGTGEFVWCTTPTPKLLNGDACGS